MARPPRSRGPLEDWLERLHGVAADTPEGLAVLADSLARGPAQAVAKAAAAVAVIEGSGDRLQEAVLAALPRFYRDLPRADPGCVAKTACIEALVRLGHEDPEPFLRGIRHVQMEPVFGGRVDTAVELRGACAFGLAPLRGREPLLAVVERLADAEAPVRISAARALASASREDAHAALRLRAFLPEPEPRARAEYLLALLRLAPRSELSLVVEHLTSADPGAVEAAALALGESRLPEAFEPLRERLASALEPALREALLRAIALLKRDEALDFLLDRLADDSGPVAHEALSALAVHRAQTDLRERVRAAVEARGEPDLERAYRRLFG